MQHSDIIRVDPARIRFKLDFISDLPKGWHPGDWDTARRMSLDDAAKHRAMAQRFREGRRWEETDLFKEIYSVRIGRGEEVRGCTTIDELLEQYYGEVDPLYADMRDHGFRERIDGRIPPLPEVFIARDGEVILSNNGNHRVAIAKLLELPWILARVRTIHADCPDLSHIEQVEIKPTLHDGAIEIPSMTTPAEKFAYYELARDCANRGAIVELGTWLAGATVYIAAGVRDAGVARPMHTYDRFRWQAIHEYKAGGKLERPMEEQAAVNLGPLRSLVEIHKGEIIAANWKGGRISCLIADAPKRFREIARALQIFGTHLEAGDVMAWQDFAYFASYDQVICMTVLMQAGIVDFVRGIYPGTTGIFTVTRRFTAEEVTEQHFLGSEWSPQQIEANWDTWASRLPEGLRPRFRCGAVLYLYDRGARDRACTLFRELLRAHEPEILPKWIYLRDKRDGFVHRYSQLFDIVKGHAGE